MKILLRKWHLCRPRMDHLPVLSVALFSLISFISTYSGIYALMRSVGGGIVGFLFAFVFTLALQLMLVYAVATFKGEQALRSKIYWLTLYTICVFFSVGFGYSFWFKHVRADKYAREGYERQVNDSLAKLTEFENRYDQLTNALIRLAQYSTNTAREEEKRGGTCGKSPKGPGPRMRLRQDDARIFNFFADHFTRDHEGIRQVLRMVRDRTATFDPAKLEVVERTLNQAVHKANAILKAPEMEELKVVLKKRLRDGRHGFESGGLKFTCPDNVLEARGQAIVKIELPELQEVHMFNPTDPKESLYLAFGRLIHLPSLAVESLPRLFPKDIRTKENERRIMLRQREQTNIGQQTTNREEFVGADALPLLLGFMVDLLIFLSAKPKPGSAPGNSPFKRMERILQEIQERSGKSVLMDMTSYVIRTVDSSNAFYLYELLQRYELRWDSGDRYIVVPIPTRTGEHRQLARMMDFLSNGRIAKAARPLRFCSTCQCLPGWWALMHKAEFADVRNVNIFKLAPNFWDEFLIEVLCFLQQEDTEGNGYRSLAKPQLQADRFSNATETEKVDAMNDWQMDRPSNNPKTGHVDNTDEGQPS